jgi:hypothetical protein
MVERIAFLLKTCFCEWKPACFVSIQLLKMMTKILFPGLFMLLFGQATAQEQLTTTRFSTFRVQPNLQGDFSFTQKWAYNWDVIKDEETGIFEVMGRDSITATDTAHLYFTANCKTNVQGGYTIRYCYAGQINDTLVLNFTDGLPAYGSSFGIYIFNDSFYFKPETVYPAYYKGEQKTYKITTQELTLNNNSYNKGDTITGYVNAAFIETIFIPGKGESKREFYLRGYFKTKIE